MDELQRDPTSRKRFLRMAGGGAIASTLAAFVAACGDDDESGAMGSGSGSGTTTQSKTMSEKGGDLAIVNYALTLEYLEADFYAQVVQAGAISDKAVADLAKSFGEDEQDHVEALRETARKLGTPAEKPRTDFASVLEGGEKKILETAAMVEDLGASAYLGQASRIKDKEILAAALSIHSVEARHAATLNQATGRKPLPTGAFAKPLPMDEVLKQVKPFLAS